MRALMGRGGRADMGHGNETPLQTPEVDGRRAFAYASIQQFSRLLIEVPIKTKYIAKIETNILNREIFHAGAL